MSHPVPTHEEVVEFVETINRGRVAVGLDTVTGLDLAACEPSSSTRCLSATYLFNAFGGPSGSVGMFFVDGLTPFQVSRLTEALHTSVVDDGLLRIPDSILAVTDYFDMAGELARDDAEEYLEALETVLRKAGLSA